MSTRTKFQKEQDQARMMHLLARGWTESEVAAELKMPPSQVASDVKSIIKTLRRDLEDDTETLVLQRRRMYLEAIREAWIEWERSKGEDAQTSIEEYWGVGEDGEPALKGRKVTKSLRRGRAAAQFLGAIKGCLDSLRELEGITPERRVRVTGKIQSVSINWDILTHLDQLPEDGAVPDQVEQEIGKILELGTVEHPPPGLKMLGNGEAHKNGD